MKVGTRLASGYGVLIALLAGVLVYQTFVISRAVRTNQELLTSSRLTLSATQQLEHLDDYNENVRKYLVTGEEGYAERATEALRAFGGTLTQLGSLSLSPPERQELSRLVDLWATYGGTGERADESAEALERSSAGLPELRRQTGLVNEAAQAAMVAELERSTAAARRTLWIALFGLAIALLFSLLVAARIVRSISESLRHLKTGTQAVAQGNFDYRLNASPEDEFSQLGADFNVMIGRLGELDQAKKDFVSHVSHELKTPLASMQEVNRLLLEELPGTLNPKQRHLVELNLKSAGRLSDMISKLLKQSQIESGSLHYEFVWQDVGELVKTIIAEFEGSGRAGGRIEADLPDGGVVVACDGPHVIQVVHNLIENALKFSPDDQPIQVSVAFRPDIPEQVRRGLRTRIRKGTKGSGYALVSVADLGPGVPDGEKDEVFGRFYQGTHGRRADGGGVGLGLALSRRIIGAHGGLVWVRDRVPTGSVFEFLLPEAVPAVPAKDLFSPRAETTPPQATRAEVG
jgi:two-component system sensor histidine kinase GlrK